MVKRKREDDVEDVFGRFSAQLHHAFKTAKGYERQRQAKRLRDPKAPPDKKARIEKEIVVLKSLDLHQAAHAHLCSALLRIKTIAESPKLPESIKAGIPKPDLTEDEKLALHNVTSALSNRAEVREVVDKAIAGICKALGIPVPEKKGKGKKPETPTAATEGTSEPAPKKPKKEPTTPDAPYADPDDEAVDLEQEELSIARLDVLLGSSSSSEGSASDSEAAGGAAQRNRKKQQHQPRRPLDDGELTIRNTALNSLSRPPRDDPASDLDPMEITEDEDDGDSADNEDSDVEGLYSDLDPMEVTDDEDDDDDVRPDRRTGIPSDEDIDFGSSGSSSSSSEFAGFSDDADDASASDSSPSQSPPPKKPKTAKPPPTPPGTSTFLPSLMGGYLSASDSEASDLDIAPATKKNRRGQRARQAIWEKKFKAEAKHLKKQQQQGKGGRDAGWDAKRGAVDGGGGKPWKRGIRNPLGPGGDKTGANAEAVAERKPKEPKRDDAGTLHPSWEARKKAKEAMGSAAFQGKKITFD